MTSDFTAFGFLLSGSLQTDTGWLADELGQSLADAKPDTSPFEGESKSK